MKTSRLYQKNRDSKSRITINEGSSRSGKTYSLMQMFIIKMIEEAAQNRVFTVVRKTLPSLKATAYKDFLEILRNNNLYSPDNHNKSGPSYKLGNSEIEFISVDDFNKVKGRKRDYLFINEANELNFNDFTQLALRTTGQIWMDYNPSHDEFHWIEEKIKTRDDYSLIHSTYVDNPFLTQETINEIERLKVADPNLWKIYGLGQLGVSGVRIYSHFQLCNRMPANYNERFYGLDFGFNHKMALAEIREKEDVMYIDEKVHESGLTTAELIAKMDRKKVCKYSYIYCDNAEPDRIKELQQAGYNAVKADKAVSKGIDTVKSKVIHLTKRSIGFYKEYRGYSWKTTADGRVLDEPVKNNDDGMDAIRYGIYTHVKSVSNEPSVRIM